MNQFVDEHTIMMREFLRNISTLTGEDLEADEELETAVNTTSSQILPIVTLTPQSPDTPHRSIKKKYQMLQYKDINLGVVEEGNFEPELIDLGKQLSILHSLLVTILSGLDDVSKFKFLFFGLKPGTQKKNTIIINITSKLPENIKTNNHY